jgi:hypothetical protein
VGQVAGVEVVVVVPETVVVVNWHGCQLTLVLVAPVTVAVSVVDCPTSRVVPADELTVTTMVLVLLLPHPLSEKKQTAAARNPRYFVIAPEFVATISLTQTRIANLPLALKLSSFTKTLVLELQSSLR